MTKLLRILNEMITEAHAVPFSQTNGFPQGGWRDGMPDRIFRTAGRKFRTAGRKFRTAGIETPQGTRIPKSRKEVMHSSVPHTGIRKRRSRVATTKNRPQNENYEKT